MPVYPITNLPNYSIVLLRVSVVEFAESAPLPHRQTGIGKLHRLLVQIEVCLQRLLELQFKKPVDAAQVRNQVAEIQLKSSVRL